MERVVVFFTLSIFSLLRMVICLVDWYDNKIVITIKDLDVREVFDSGLTGGIPVDYSAEHLSLFQEISKTVCIGMDLVDRVFLPNYFLVPRHFDVTKRSLMIPLFLNSDLMILTLFTAMGQRYFVIKLQSYSMKRGIDT